MRLLSSFNRYNVRKFNSTVAALLFLLTSSLSSHAQMKPDASAVSVPSKTGTVTPVQPPAYPTGAPVNYIRSWEPQQPFSASSDVASTDRQPEEVMQSTQYFDGLGRPIETVNWQASPNKTDIVTAHTYDAFGREQYNYLPYTSSDNSGGFKTDPFGEQSSFYTNTYPTEQGAIRGEQFFYGHTVFEPSPLNRPLKTFAPGNAWAGSEGGSAEKAVSVQYLVNTPADHVPVWTIGFDAQGDANNIPSSTTEYGAGTLYKTVTIDEQGSATVEYKDLEGHVVLKKVGIGAVASDYSGFTGFLSTFYVYDDLGQLRFVVQPKAVAQLVATSGWALTTTQVAELCFRYEYDDRGRMTAKKVPGAGWVYMVYDSRDRLTYTQDANMRGQATPQWAYTFYDALNRPVETGVLAYSGSESDLQTAGQNLAYASDGTGGRPLPSGGYTLYPLVYNFYDNYAFTTKQYDAGIFGWLAGTGGNPEATVEASPSSPSGLTTGLMTGQRVRVIQNPADLSQGSLLESVSFYDDKGRVVLRENDNHKGGFEESATRYSFRGRAVNTYLFHTNPAANNADGIGVLTSLGADHMERPGTTGKGVIYQNNGYSRSLSIQMYDALGKLRHKEVGQKQNKDGYSPAEADDYAYNIRGWLKGVNWYSDDRLTYASQINGGVPDPPYYAKWFAYDLSYDWGMTSTTSQYGGNISGQRWKTAGNAHERAYGYRYDEANRLLQADFTQYTNGGWIQDGAVNFNVVIGNGTDPTTAYDENGNLLYMQQLGWRACGCIHMDDLHYTYSNGGNKLQNVVDGFNDPTTVQGDFRTSSLYLSQLGGQKTVANAASYTDYTYDGNGSLTSDKNKDIQSISYNHLDLPWQIGVKNSDGSSSKGTITYLYDALGNKLQKTVSEAASSFNNNVAKTTVTDYIGLFTYENNVLQYISNEEGRTRMVTTTLPDNTTSVDFPFDYFIRDHLGNVRTVLTDETKQDIYPALTFEPDGRTVEKQYYYLNYEPNAVSNPAGLSGSTGFPYLDKNGGNGATDAPVNPNPSITPTAQSATMYKMNGSTGVRSDLGITLKVMAGDDVNIWAKSWWQTPPAGTTINNTYPVTSAFYNLFLGFVGSGAGLSSKGVNSDLLSANAPTTDPLGAMLGGANQPPTGATAPKAGVNWILFDDQFVPVANGYSAVSPTGNEVTTHTFDAPITQSGYLYVYCSNESDRDVYFDNLQVAYNHGPLAEETHYYPFGLTMTGISSEALNFGGPANKYKFNKGSELQSKEWSDGSGLEEYDTHFRQLDPQLGRWNQIDPKTEDQEDISPYNVMANDPILHNDPLGDEDGDCCKTLWEHIKRDISITADQLGLPTMFNDATEVARTINVNANPLTPVVELATGKSVESDLTQDKPRSNSAVEAVIAFLPGAKLESTATKATEKALISLDNNALIHAIENGGSETVKKAIGADKPIISMTAAKEYLAKGSKSDLRNFMNEIGASISKNGASEAQVNSIQKSAENMGRKVGSGDASIIGGAINNKATILTRDQRMIKFLKSANLPVKSY